MTSAAAADNVTCEEPISATERHGDGGEIGVRQNHRDGGGWQRTCNSWKPDAFAFRGRRGVFDPGQARPERRVRSSLETAACAEPMACRSPCDTGCSPRSPSTAAATLSSTCNRWDSATWDTFCLRTVRYLVSPLPRLLEMRPEFWHMRCAYLRSLLDNDAGKARSCSSPSRNPSSCSVSQSLNGSDTGGPFFSDFDMVDGGWREGTAGSDCRFFAFCTEGANDVPRCHVPNMGGCQYC